MAGSKAVSFEDTEHADGHTSGSDEDRGAVEVSFDPSNPHRRKSSLVTSDITIPKQLHRTPGSAPDKAQCIVHQFFESQRKIDGHDLDTVDEQSSSVQSGNTDGAGSSSHAEITRRDSTLDKMVEPKGSHHAKSKKSRCTVLDAGAGSDSEAGQVDELAWKDQISKSLSEMDLAAAATGKSLARTGSGSLSKEAAAASRLLTKKQLSDMAWGVRELSRRLGSMRLKFRVKSVFILTKIHDEDLISKTRELTRWLLSRERGTSYTVYVEKGLKENKKFNAGGLVKELEEEYEGQEKKDVEDGGGSSDSGNGHPTQVARRLRYWDDAMCRARPHTFDFVVTLGGDGTVLYASWLFQRIVPPVLSFSLGSLGFLTKFEFDEYEKTMTTALEKGVIVSLRLRFEGTVMRSQKRRKHIQQSEDGAEDSQKLTEEEEEAVERKRDLVEELIGEEQDDKHTHRPDGTFEVLNEIVIDRGPNPTLSTIELFGDEEHLTTVQADGICVSTPTGSTAYNLAAGGSLCHPENPVMLVSAICAHTLSFRPIVLPDTIVLRIGCPYDARTGSWASFDGRERTQLHPGDYVTVSASRYPFASVQAQGRRSEDWVNSISGKLGWNNRQRQKAYKEWS